MTIKHIWEKFEELQAFIVGKTAISNIFTWGIMAWKPFLKENPWQSYLYFEISSNNPIVESNRTTKKILEKEAVIDFYLVFPDKWTPDVEIYEALSVISNNICEQEILLGDLKVSEILEWNQTWVVRADNDTPFLYAQYVFYYECV